MSKRTLYLDKILNFTVAASTEDGKLVSCEVDTDGTAPREGYIYKGVIKNVLDGMQAAFIDCGLERNCYIPQDDLSPYCSGAADKKLSFKEGDEVVVQIVKPPIGKKGAKVTTHLSFIGKSLIYLPQTDFVGVSNKISDGELRTNLISSARAAIKKGDGLVVRAAAPFITRDNITAELDYLRSLYQKVCSDAKGIKKGLVFGMHSLPLKVLRDSKADKIERIVIGCDEVWESVAQILHLMPDYAGVYTELYAGGRDMLDEYGVAKQIVEAASPEVKLGCGANLVIEHTEALTVIDVNTGKFVGEDNLEQTVYMANLAAAREIARQVQLRNIGGIVVVDFIDMKQEKHRKALAAELTEALRGDSAQCKVLPMSEFGLIEFTRRRQGKDLADILTSTCTPCGGRGYTLRKEIVLMNIRADVLRLLHDGAAGVTVAADSATAGYISGRQDFLDEIRDRFPSAALEIKADAEKKSGYSCTPHRRLK